MSPEAEEICENDATKFSPTTCLSVYLSAFCLSVCHKNCLLPDDWHGQWLLDGHNQVTITSTTVSGVGTCSQQDGYGKFLLMNSDGCFKCMAFNQKHPNLLQYKISYCGVSHRLEDVCDSIENDAMLHTMVKENGDPIPCPFQGPWEFSYTDWSHEECDSPRSDIAACADESKSQINFRKCPRLSHTFDRSENIQCLATWYNGHDHFLYAKFTSSDMTTGESPYRCFMYTVTGAQGKMAMSTGPACKDMQNSEIGPVVFKLYFRRDMWPQPGFKFPVFFPPKSKWRDVRGRLKFEVNGRREMFTVSDIPESDIDRPEMRRRVVSMGNVDTVRQDAEFTETTVAFVTDDKCESAYACIQFTKHSDKVVEVTMGRSTKDTLSACEDTNLQNVPKLFLIPYDPVPVECPMPGVHSYKDLGSGCTGTLRIGCQDKSEIEVEGRCDNQQAVDVLQCYANWTDTSTIHVLARKLNDETKAAYCLVFRHSSEGYLLESSAECGVNTLTIMSSPIKFSIDPNTSKCSASRSRSVGGQTITHPRDSRDQSSGGIYHTNDQARDNRGSDHKPEVIKTPSGSGISADMAGKGPRKTSGVINADNDKDGASPGHLGHLSNTVVFLVSLVSILAVRVCFSDR
ncbi:hypothetical protein PoB_003021100 [Plakobranchus ocellatus]|uniref:Uncharacterized protein n=1 Tax=Plakobranchus ocellatus TaxID=259542 RepID=A0AAV4AAQ7_9GAST|nr:hypothetical protein PoB_003021100 [Plakobranchus ocellatus]